VVRYIDFVKCLQGQAARPGTRLHGISGLVPLVSNVFNVNIDLGHIHSDHFLDGACNLLLYVASHFADIDVVFDDKINVGNHGILMDGDANTYIHTPVEDAIHTTRDGRQAANAGDGLERPCVRCWSVLQVRRWFLPGGRL